MSELFNHLYKEADKVCARCVMTSNADTNLKLDENGICNHCLRYDELISSRVENSDPEAFSKIVAQIKAAGKNKPYDCVIGVSGGVDSTYVAYLCKQHGLRPLAVHFDNGWNSDLAIKNIEKTLKSLEIELYTVIANWKEFKSLQIAFLKASVPDGEVPTDHAISSVLWQTASKFKIKYILSGMNFATEAVNVPEWSYGHSDWKYIRNVNKKYGTTSLDTYPHFTFTDLFINTVIRRIRIISPLNYIQYNKEEAIKTLETEIGWQRYEGKHYESFYTKFYQGYLLPIKFKIDKRFGHCSDLINSGQANRAEALNELMVLPYDKDKIGFDISYVRKKFDLSEKDMDTILNAPPKTFRHMPNSYDFVQKLRRIVNNLRKLGLYPK